MTIEKEIKMDTVPETDIVLDDLPGISTEQLDANISVKGLSDDTKYYQEKITTFTGAYDAGDFTLTFGFRPKKITMLATREGTGDGHSDGTALIDIGGNLVNGCKYHDGDFTNVYEINDSKIINIKDSVSCTAYVSSIISTGCVLTLDNNNYLFNILVTAEG